MGEWTEAAAALKPLLKGADSDAPGGKGPVPLWAQYLDACFRAWTSGDVSALGALVERAEYAEMKSVIYYTLWKTLAGTASAESWKTRLLAEFPHSPESRIAAAESGGAAQTSTANVSGRPRALWLLLPGRNGFSFTQSPSGSAALVPADGISPGGTPVPAKTLQTGLYSSEANARIQADRLIKAGFSPSLVRRPANNAEYWAVTVPAGQDVNRTIAELKNAGFESFPVF
jgi:hypothetical protein